MRIEAMDAFYLSQLAIAICLGLKTKSDSYANRLQSSPVYSVAKAIQQKDESNPIARSFLQWAKAN